MLTVNLFDANFRQSVCSVAYQTPRYIEYARDQMEFDGITIFTDAYINNPVVDEVKSRIKIGWLHEPECLHADIYEEAWENRGKFDFILTYYAPFLEHWDFKFCPYGGVWINEKDWRIWPKSKPVSLLSGDKLSTDGHRIRRYIADMMTEERLGFIDLYGYRGQAVDYSQETKLKVTADYFFSVVTETCRQDNLFTEWLLDCLIVGTIPIFWGCPNIDKFFDTDGILSFEGVDDFLNIVPELSPKLYRSRMKAVNTNFHLAKEYAITEDWIYKNILRGLWYDKRLSTVIRHCRG